MNTGLRPHIIFICLLIPALAGLYATGLGNGLVFDDDALKNGTVFGQYGALWPLKTRLLSYGSFVWVHNLFGGGIPLQRLVNILMHSATSVALYALVLRLLARADEQSQETPPAPLRTAAAQVALACWAFNPVAVYAVAYLIQRSILMATLGVVLSLLALTQGLRTGKVVWYSGALVLWVLAVASKEYAVTLPLAALPLVVFWLRPSPAALLRLGVVALVALAAMGGLLSLRYGHLLGQVFDQQSAFHVQQLKALQPDLGNLYPLSVLNQAWLFFQYGAHWLLPDVRAMSLDLRPPFPLTVLAWPQALGMAGYLALLAAGTWLLLKRSGHAALAGAGLLVPALLFVTEFATVWIQDPFVLYRSYLWSVTLPLLLALGLMHLAGAKTLRLGGTIVVVVLAALSFERISSLADEQTAWTDALQKVDASAPDNAVGRWRAPLNLARLALVKGDGEAALLYNQQARQLDAPDSLLNFQDGGAYKLLKRPQEAIQAFNRAEQQGYKGFALYMQRGELLMTEEHFAQAYADLELALDKAPDPVQRMQALKLVAEAANLAKAYPRAVVFFEELHRTAPTVLPYVLSLAYAHFGAGNATAALAVLNDALAKAPVGVLYHARAQVLAQSGQKQAALADLAQALEVEPHNSTYLQLKRQLEGAHP